METDLRDQVSDLRAKVEELQKTISDLIFSFQYGQLKTELVNEAMREVIARDMRKG